MKQKGILYYALFFLFPFHVFSQINVTTTAVANTLAQTIAGNGVTVSNAALNCGPGAAGTFTYGGANLGINGGIVLTTGTAADVANPGTYFCAVANGNNFSDPDLVTIEPLATYDACVLQFDFVPICNSISVTYVFGSEEYPAFVNSSYNDGFGIFLTGPNPGGGNYTSLNIGTLPNTVPVSINNVNASTNSGYFHDNYSSPNNDVAYDGYTIPVTSTKSVVPCSTYHMKIAIADAGDEIYDSGVFVGSNAVSCQNAPAITATTTPSGCGGNTGTAAVTVTNYTGAITYSWTPGGQTTASITGLAPGTYSCIVGLNLSCGTITQTVTAVVGSTGSTLALTTTSVDPKCNNGTNGSASVTITGGSAPFTTSWNTAPVQTTTTASSLGAGTYVVTVNDNAGCTQTATVTLNNPAPIQAGVSTTPSSCTGSNGTATATVISGGTAPYNYAWSTTPVQLTQTATGLNSGTYTVVISDINTCTLTVSATVNQQGGGWTAAAATPTNVACFGGNNGATSVTITNPGANVFTYSWTTNPVQNTQTTSAVTAGSYSCTVVDNNGCTQTVTVTVTQPTQIVAGNFTPTSSKCGSPSGGVTLGSVSGGTAPYTYSWNSTPVQTTQNLTNVIPGTYTITITDANGCSVQSAHTVGMIPGLPLTSGTSPDICNSGIGSANVTANGNPPYQYLWNTTPPQTTQSVSGLNAGTYMVAVVDAFGCSDSISVNINNQDDILNTVFTTNPSGEIYAEDQVTLSMTNNTGWTLDSAYLSDGTYITQNTNHVFPQYGMYYATYYYTSVHGCKDSVIAPIKVTDYMTLYIPNAFSPNGDGTNDYFRAEGTFISSFEMFIFDRWGKLVTKLDDIGKNWNGTYKGNDAPQDTYVYKGTATDVFGRHVSFQGQIHLVR